MKTLLISLFIGFSCYGLLLFFKDEEKQKSLVNYQGDKIVLNESLSYAPVYPEPEFIRIPNHPTIWNSEVTLTICYANLFTPVSGENYQKRFMVALVHPEKPSIIIQEGRSHNKPPGCWDFEFKEIIMGGMPIHFNLFYEQSGGPSYIEKKPGVSINVEYKAAPFILPKIVDHVGDRFRKLERRIKALEKKVHSTH